MTGAGNYGTTSDDAGRTVALPADESSTDPVPAVPGYAVHRVLGRGGMGVVYLATHLELKRPVALKMQAAGEFERFRTEAEAVARLQHPNVVQVFEVGTADGAAYIALEYVAGGTLRDALAGTPLPARRAAEVVAAATRGVAHAHERGVLHRDLKPANVLLAEAGDPGSGDRGQASATDLLAQPPGPQTPKVTDFGLAKRLDAASDGPTSRGAVVGTPSYMAPEQARGGRAGVAADVYGLGAVLYECLTGRPPFRAASGVETLRQVIDDEPVPVRRLAPGVPRDLETVCLKCLEKVPERRYAAAADLVSDLEAWLAGRPVSARPLSPPRRAMKWCRRQPAAAGLIAALVLGVAAVATLAAGFLRQRDRAVAAERDLRAELIERELAAARLAIQRGAWRDALAGYDRAVARGHPVTPALRLDRVLAYTAVNDPRRAAEELAALAAEPDLGDVAGRVSLYRGEAIMGVDDAAAESLIRKALDGPLPPADRLYAEALVAPTTPAALAACLRAIDADPFHQDARGMATLLLVLLGRFDEASALGNQAAALFPEQRDLLAVAAFADVMRGQRAAADATLARFAASYSPQERAGLAALFDIGEMMRHPPNDPKGLSLWAVVVRLPALRRYTDAPSLRLPLVLRRTALRLYAAIIKGGLIELAADTPPDSVVAEVAKFGEMHPDGLATFYLANVRFRRLQSNPPNDPMATADALSSVVAQFRTAADRSSIYAAVRPAALEGAATAAALRANFDAGRPDAPSHRAASDLIRQRLTLGPALGVDTYAVWARSAAHTDPTLARAVLREWEVARPREAKEVAPVRAAVELRAGDYPAAIRAARRALEINPKDAASARVSADATARLLEFGKDLSPP